MRSKTYYVITWIIGILGFIGGIILGNVIPNLDYNIITESYASTFNTTIMISSWVGTIILCLIFGGISTILGYLEELGAGQVEIKTTPSIQFEQSEVIEEGDWLCPKCGKLSKKYVGSCGCGYTKRSGDFWECPKCHIFTPYNKDNECMNCHWKA